jgi:hypothetical protein
MYTGTGTGTPEQEHGQDRDRYTGTGRPGWFEDEGAIRTLSGKSLQSIELCIQDGAIENYMLKSSPI